MLRKSSKNSVQNSIAAVSIEGNFFAENNGQKADIVTLLSTQPDCTDAANKGVIGDFDGCGLDEVAVYVGDSEYALVQVWKYHNPGNENIEVRSEGVGGTRLFTLFSGFSRQGLWQKRKAR